MSETPNPDQGPELNPVAKTREKKEAERRSIANLRDDMRARLAPFDGGLVRLSNSLD